MERKHYYITNKKVLQLIAERDVELYPTANDYITAAILCFSNGVLTEKRFQELMGQYVRKEEESSPFKFSV